MSNMNEISTIESSAVTPELSAVQPVAPVAEIAPAVELSQPREIVKPIKEQDVTSEIKLVRSDIPVSSLGFPITNNAIQDDRVAILSDKVRGEQIPPVAA